MFIFYSASKDLTILFQGLRKCMLDSGGGGGGGGWGLDTKTKEIA
jgi:hypothetical protein